MLRCFKIVAQTVGMVFGGVVGIGGLMAFDIIAASHVNAYFGGQEAVAGLYFAGLMILELGLVLGVLRCKYDF